MSQSSSYKVATFATSVQAEIRRLNAQVDLFWPGEGKVLRRIGLRDGMRVLDCGCGPGRLIELMTATLPQLHCTGLEVDPTLVNVARLHLANCGLDSCEVVQGSAEEPPLPADAYDFIVMRLVLEHLVNPEAALQSLSGLLRPGGRLVVISNDFDFHLRTWPPVRELDTLYDAYRSSRRQDGGDPCIGRRLPQLLMQTGLEVVAFEIEVVHSLMTGDARFLKSEGTGIPTQLSRDGFLDEGTLNSLLYSWRDMLATPDHGMMRSLFVAAGMKATQSFHNISTDKVRGQVERSLPQAKNTDAITGQEHESINLLLQLVSLALKRDGISPIDCLADLGMDSLAAMDLQESIIAQTGVEVPLPRLLDNVSIDNLARYVNGHRSQQKSIVEDTLPSDTGPAEVEEGEL